MAAPTREDRIYRLLFDDACSLCLDWHMYDSFFRDPARVEILNKSAGQTFGWVQRMLENSLKLRIERLLQRPRNGHQQNLVLETLIEEVQQKDAVLAAQLLTRLTIMRANAAPVVAHRHKALAHSDLNVRLNQCTLPDVFVGQIDSLIDEIESFLNHYSVRTQNTSLEIRSIDFGAEGPGTLVRLLEHGLEFRAQNPGWFLPERFREGLKNR